MYSFKHVFFYNSKYLEIIKTIKGGLAYIEAKNILSTRALIVKREKNIF